MQGLKEQYRQHTLRKVLFIAICVLLMFVALAVSIIIGGYDISFIRVYEVIWDHITGVELTLYSREWYDDQIVWNNRLPRVLFAMVAGAGLAISGVMMQSIMKNPLAEPYTTGVSAGAYFGVAVSIVLVVDRRTASLSVHQFPQGAGGVSGRTGSGRPLGYCGKAEGE